MLLLLFFLIGVFGECDLGPISIYNSYGGFNCTPSFISIIFSIPNKYGFNSSTYLGNNIDVIDGKGNNYNTFVFDNNTLINSNFPINGSTIVTFYNVSDPTCNVSINVTYPETIKMNFTYSVIQPYCDDSNGTIIAYFDGNLPFPNYTSYGFIVNYTDCSSQDDLYCELPPGNYTLTEFSGASQTCETIIPFQIVPFIFPDVEYSITPSMCGENGTITINTTETYYSNDNSSFVLINATYSLPAGNYTIYEFLPDSCFNQIPFEIPTIDCPCEINFTFINQTVFCDTLLTVYVNPNLTDANYSMDGGEPQTSNVFYNVSIGPHIFTISSPSCNGSIFSPFIIRHPVTPFIAFSCPFNETILNVNLLYNETITPSQVTSLDNQLDYTNTFIYINVTQGQNHTLYTGTDNTCVLVQEFVTPFCQCPFPFANISVTLNRCNTSDIPVVIIVEPNPGVSFYLLGDFNIYNQTHIYENLPYNIYTIDTFYNQTFLCPNYIDARYSLCTNCNPPGKVIASSDCNNISYTIQIFEVENANYSLNGGEPTEDPIFSDLPPGNYSLFIYDRDNPNCNKTLNGTLPDIDFMSTISLNITDATCTQLGYVQTLINSTFPDIFYILEKLDYGNFGPFPSNYIVSPGSHVITIQLYFIDQLVCTKEYPFNISFPMCNGCNVTYTFTPSSNCSSITYNIVINPIQNAVYFFK